MVLFNRTCAIALSLCLFSTLSFAQSKDWSIVADDIDPANYYGVTVANGMIGLVSSPEPLRVSQVILNGAFDTYGRGRVDNILSVFEFANARIHIDDEAISRKNISNYKQTLDMQNARLITTFDVGDKASVKHEMMALRHLPFVALTNITIQAKQDVKLTVFSEIKSPDVLREVKNLYSHVVRPHVRVPLLTSVAKSPSGRHDVAASTTFVFSEPHESQPVVTHWDWDYNRHEMYFEKRLTRGTDYEVGIVGSVLSSEHVPDPFNEAERFTTYAVLQGKDELLRRHREDWSKLWDGGDIMIEGDLRSQIAARSGLYHLYSFARAGTAYSLSPMGLSGLGYNGHVFWDTELWMYPAILMLQPDIARSLLEYRFERLGSARKKAANHGYKGAMYPWESASDGHEATPYWALTGHYQHHISGCIAWAVWKYYQVTGDKEWLANRGYPMMKEIADFWVSRAIKDEAGYHIKNVIAADEFAENVDDNAFTNAVASLALTYATKAAEHLGLEPNKAWESVADGLVILKFKDGVTREHATYNGETVKQADVNLLAYPLGVITDEDQIKKDLEYYLPRFDPRGPAMTQAVLSVLYNQIGETQKAFELFEQAYQPNEVPPFGVIAETAGGTNPYFATGAGGMLQSVLAGFGGLRITDGGVEQQGSKLPKNWKKLTLKGVGAEDRTVVVER